MRLLHCIAFLSLSAHAWAQSPEPSEASATIHVDLPQGSVDLHAETDDPTRSVRLTVRVPPQRASFGDAYLTSLAGYAVAAAIGAGIGVPLALSMRTDPAPLGTTIVAGLAAGAAFVGPLGPGMSLGTMSNGPPGGALWALILAPFAAWAAGGFAAVGPIAGDSAAAMAEMRNVDPSALAVGTLLALLGSAVVAPLVSAVLFVAVPMNAKSAFSLGLGPGFVYGTF
jgi:hypothetical protein